MSLLDYLEEVSNQLADLLGAQNITDQRYNQQIFVHAAPILDQYQESTSDEGSAGNDLEPASESDYNHELTGAGIYEHQVSQPHGRHLQGPRESGWPMIKISSAHQQNQLLFANQMAASNETSEGNIQIDQMPSLTSWLESSGRRQVVEQQQAFGPGPSVGPLAAFVPDCAQCLQQLVGQAYL